MSTKRDYYEVLGVTKTAAKSEIEQAYRKLAVQFHPDRVAPDKKEEAREKFKEISEAYAVLSDEQKKKLYDQYGHAGIDGRYTDSDIFQGADFSSIFHDLGFGRGGGAEDIFGDVFDIFGGGRRSSRRYTATRGSDLEIPATITLEEAYKGTEKSVQYYRTEPCRVCKGTGAKPGTGKKVCTTCQGAGQQTSGFGGFFSFSQPCQKCHGTGEIIDVPCRECGGRGKTKASEHLSIKIPKGVDNGTSIRVRGKGEAGERGGPPGDLYIMVRVLKHEKFAREDENLYTDTKIPFNIAVLGGEIDVMTLDGNVKMKIPPGTQSNKVFRIKCKGMPDVHSNEIGDLYIRVIIDVPAKLTEKQRELLREFGRQSSS